jgi:hypothetical protein
VSKFTSKWLNFPETGQDRTSKTVKSSSAVIDTGDEEGCEKSELSPSQGIVLNNLLSRLQGGSEWFTAQHEAWLAGQPDAASDERFSSGVVAWASLEQTLRQVFGYQGCVFGPDRKCPGGATVVCDYCV